MRDIIPYPHSHVICVKCKKIVDPDLASPRDMSREVEDETGFRVLTPRLGLFALCGD